MPYDRVKVNMEREEVSLERTMDPRLISTSTGGVEASCANCLLPFGLVLGVIGLAATGVACANDRPGSVLFVMGWTMLITGLLCVATSWVWWYYRKRTKCRSWTILEADTNQKKPVL